MRVMMKPVLPLLMILFLGGCGGGGGKYYPPSISLNPYGINKRSFNVADVIDNDRISIAEFREDPAKDLVIEGRTYYYFREIYYDGSRYTLAIPIDNYISIVNTDGKIVTKLKTPRYTRDAIAVELKHLQRGSLLAILIGQQTTSHSSTLYVLDSDFRPIYKEHLLGARWISKKHDPNGDLLFVSTEDSWQPNNETVTISGNWQYNIFETIK